MRSPLTVLRSIAAARLVALVAATLQAGCSSDTARETGDAAVPTLAEDAAQPSDAEQPGSPDAARADASDHSAADGGSALASAGCRGGDLAYPAGTTVGELTHAGLARRFRVHVPPGYDGRSAAPLVLMFHGGGGSGLQFEAASSRMDPVSDREGFIAVYPDGTGQLRTWNGGGCCGSAVTNTVDDVGFVRALLDHLEAALCLDTRRVYAAGMSNGGILSHRLACELADRLAAIAPVAGTDMTSSCSPARPIPVMQIHGTADGHVPWDGGEGCGPAGVPFTSVPETIERWRARNGCRAESARSFEQGDGHCETYEGCSAGANVVLCSIEGGGHNWPGGEPPAAIVPCPANGFQSSTFLASEAIWSFFAAHALPVP